jgi:hypothetical protein
MVHPVTPTRAISPATVAAADHPRKKLVRADIVMRETYRHNRTSYSDPPEASLDEIVIGRGARGS